MWYVIVSFVCACVICLVLCDVCVACDVSLVLCELVVLCECYLVCVVSGVHVWCVAFVMCGVVWCICVWCVCIWCVCVCVGWLANYNVLYRSGG